MPIKILHINFYLIHIIVICYCGSIELFCSIFCVFDVDVNLSGVSVNEYVIISNVFFTNMIVLTLLLCALNNRRICIIMKFGFFTSHTISNFVVVFFFVTDKHHLHYYCTIIQYVIYS